MNRSTLLTDIAEPFDFSPRPESGIQGFSLDGVLEAGAGSRFLTLSTEDEGPREVYAVEILGNIGQDYFIDVFDAQVEADAGFTGVPVPDFRLNLRPLGGRDLDALFPNGFSLSTPCDRGPRVCDLGEIGPASILFSTGADDFATTYSFLGAPVEIAPIPLPSAIVLSSLALFSLGWAGSRRHA